MLARFGNRSQVLVWDPMRGLSDRLPGVVELGLMVINSHPGFARSIERSVPDDEYVAEEMKKEGRKKGRKWQKYNQGEPGVIRNHFLSPRVYVSEVV